MADTDVVDGNVGRGFDIGGCKTQDPQDARSDQLVTYFLDSPFGNSNDGGFYIQVCNHLLQFIHGITWDRTFFPVFGWINVKSGNDLDHTILESTVFQQWMPDIPKANQDDILQYIFAEYVIYCE